MKLCLLMLLLAAGVIVPASAQTTQPAPQQAVPPQWEYAVQNLSKSLAAGEHCKSQLTDDCAIRAFDVSSRQLEDLIAHTGGATLLMAKAYLAPSDTIASDMAAAVADADVSEDVKKVFTPAEGEPTIRANTTASRWAQSALALAGSDPFSILVFIRADSTSAAQSAGGQHNGQIFFVMFKGRRSFEGVYRTSLIVYGDAQQATMTSAR